MADYARAHQTLGPDRRPPDVHQPGADVLGALDAAAKERGCPINALVAEIDIVRLDADQPPNLTSAIRQWLFERRQSAPQ